MRRTSPAPRTAALLVALVTLPACATAGDPGPTFQLGGAWDGWVDAGGQRIDGTLTLEQEVRSLEAAFVAPMMDLSAEGDGEVADDGAVWIELAYDLQCPGVALLEGTVSEAGDEISGTLEATDCTGTIDGTFRFSR